MTSQQYCLRWNNHRSNLLTVFDELLQNEAFTDVTLACEGGPPIKCHRMVLAACSPYFQHLFTDLPCKHPVVVLKDVKNSEIKAILEYMYRGEVNVAQDQLAALLKVAEALKVKGLVEENRKSEESEHSPSISTSSAMQTVHSSSNSPPPPIYKPYGGYKDGGRLGLPLWAVPGLPLPPQVGDTHPQLGYDDMSPLKRKKLSSLLMNRDTPILRTVLGQGNADSSQPVSLVCHPDSQDMHHHNGDGDRIKHMKNEPSEDAQSPYTDFTPTTAHSDDDKTKPTLPSTSPHFQDMRNASTIATYVPTQKPEWKRYKQYTRNDIMSAIEAVRNGMSALQAARKYGVPSRTLYDKVKKLGITTSRPFKRGSNGGACFPYSPYGGESDEAMNNNSSLLEGGFLQEEREALAAMAAAAAHAAAVHHSPYRSPSPLKYQSLTPSPAPGSDSLNEEDHVEDLSTRRKPGVIMAPVNVLKKEEMLIESIKEEARREVAVEEAE